MIKTRINENWSFYPFGEETKSVQIALPHDAMILEKRIPNLENGPAMGFYPGGKYVYKKLIYADEAMAAQTVLLEFEGVYMDSHVFLNGEEIGGRFYGYSNFFVELTGKLIPNENNEITVIVDNSRQPNSRWYSGSGIYRSVNLWIGEASYIKPEGIRIQTLSTEPATVEITVDAVYADDCTVRLEIWDQDKVVTSCTGSKTAIVIPNGKLWSAASPNLYTLRVSLKDRDRVYDMAQVRFGVRALQWNAEEGLLVNGVPEKLRGGCIHHDHGILGAAAYDKADRRRILKLKQLGYNAIRYAHNPMGKNLLDICDELGMYVLDEAFDSWKETQTSNDYALNFDEEWQKDAASMVSKDYNHPSVIVYCIGNEITDVSLPTGAAICKKLAACFKHLDDTRPITLAVNTFLASLVHEQAKKGVTDFFGSQQVNEIVTLIPKIMASSTPEYIEGIIGECADAVDIMGYNYSHWLYEGTHALKPNRVIVSSETYPVDMFSNWAMAQAKPYVIGDFHWTAWDYLGEAGVGLPVYGSTEAPFSKAYPCRTAACGNVDLTGFPETAAYYQAMIWGAYQGAYMAVRPVNHSGEPFTFGKWRLTDSIPSWTWSGCEGRIAEVEVYGQGHTAELLLNGVRVGRQEMKELRTQFRIPYTPGELKAVLLDEAGNVVSEAVLRTASQNKKLEVLPEETTVHSGEIVFVPIHLTDDRGTLCMTENVDISVTVSGGKLLALGSGCPESVESYRADHFTSWHGRVLAVIQAGEVGTVTVCASAPGLVSASACVKIGV